MKKFLKELWFLFIERHKVHKALRLLNKQEWSVEFLTALLVRSANILKKSLIMTIQSPNGIIYTVKVDENQKDVKYKDESIFDHLDNQVRVKQFLEDCNIQL